MQTGPSWLNVDASPTLRFERLPVIGKLYTRNATRFPADARYGDITREPIVAPGSADAVYCSHVLEHMPLAQMRAALGNILIALKPGGRFRVIVPDLKSRCQAYMDSDSPSAAHDFLRQTGLGRERAAGGSLARRLVSALGNSEHQWMYDEHAMRLELEQAGFAAVRRCAFGDSDLEAFAEVEDPTRFVDPVSGAEVALECRKPSGP